MTGTYDKEVPTMDRRMSESLDQFITGHYGEDQLRYACAYGKLHPCQCDDMNRELAEDPEEARAWAEHEAEQDRREYEHERHLDENGIGP